MWALRRREQKGATNSRKTCGQDSRTKSYVGAPFQRILRPHLCCPPHTNKKRGRDACLRRSVPWFVDLFPLVLFYRLSHREFSNISYHRPLCWAIADCVSQVAALHGPASRTTRVVALGIFHLVPARHLHGFYEEEERGSRPGEVSVHVSLPVELLRCLRRLFERDLTNARTRSSMESVQLSF